MERQEIHQRMQAAWQRIEYHKGQLDIYGPDNVKMREHHRWWMGYERGRVSGLKVAYKMAGGQ
jgi:hypothetical protein